MPVFKFKKKSDTNQLKTEKYSFLKILKLIQEFRSAFCLVFILKNGSYTAVGRDMPESCKM